jgi:hypothetical protein
MAVVRSAAARLFTTGQILKKMTQPRAAVAAVHTARGASTERDGDQLEHSGTLPRPCQVTFNAAANTTYFFMVGSTFGVPGGNLVFNLTGPPANDELGGAAPLTLNTPVTQDTTLATSAPTDPTDCVFGATHNTVWFSFTATASEPLNLDRSGSNYGGRSAVLTDLGSGPVLIGCGFGAGLRFDATAGRTYFFMDSGFEEGGGQLQLTLRPGIIMTVTADPTGTVSRSGTAVVSGTLACNPASPPQGGAGSPTLDIELRQKISKTLVIQGHNFLEIPCPTTPTAWSVTIIGDNGPFRKGRAEVFVSGHGCDQVGCANPEVRQSVRLTGKQTGLGWYGPVFTPARRPPQGPFD